MKTIRSFAYLAAALFGCLPPSAFAQVVLTPTTLSVALTPSSSQLVSLTSATTVSGYTIVAGTDIYVDNELMTVEPLNGTVSGTTFAVIRGQGGTSAAPHASGALAFVGPPNGFPAKPAIEPQGSCTRSALAYIPFINIRTGIISDCVGGQWVQGARTAAPRWRVYAPEPGGTIYTSLNSTGTTLSATTLYCTEVDLPSDKLLTGAAVLAGTTVATDKWLVILYDSAGNAIANSALAGATTATASVFQARAFTSPYFAVGPAQYFACFQTNGTTDTARMAVTQTNDNVLTKGQTGGTFGTVAKLTVPTSFTTAVGPYIYLY